MQQEQTKPLFFVIVQGKERGGEWSGVCARVGGGGIRLRYEAALIFVPQFRAAIKDSC